jgi:hypothetical protein
MDARSGRIISAAHRFDTIVGCARALSADGASSPPPITSPPR